MAKEGESSVQVVKVCPTVEELRLKPSTNATRLLCPVAGCKSFPFKSQRSLTYHINALHPHLSKYHNPDKEVGQLCHFHCPQKQCVYSDELGQRWFTTFEHLKYHYINTHDEKRFSCGKCKKLFGWERDRDYHEGECGKTFACGLCSAKYPSRRALLTHCTRKQHPVPAEFEKPEKRTKTSTDVKTTPQSVVISTSDNTKQISLSHIIPSHVQTSLGKTAVKGSSRPILPKGIVVLTSGALPHLVCKEESCQVSLGHHQQPSLTPGTVHSSSVGTVPLTQDAAVAVSNGRQTTAQTSSVSVGPQVPVANMAIQVSTQPQQSATCPLGTCHMGTQVSGPGVYSKDGPQISDMAIQTSVEVAHSSTQMAGGLGGDQMVEHASTQVSAVLVNSATQMDFGPEVCAVAIQTVGGADVANMAIQASSDIAEFAHIATQATGNTDNLFDISVQAPDPLTHHGLSAVTVISSHLASTTAAGACASSAACDANTSPSKGNGTSSTGTQMFTTALTEESETATTGMQTSLTLIPNRLKSGVIAQTQTPGDYILKSAMASASIPLMKSRKNRAKGSSPGRRRSTKSSEVQTQDCFTHRKKRRVKRAQLGERRNSGIQQDLSIATQTLPVVSAAQVPSTQVQANPTLSSSATAEDTREWDPFLLPPTPPPTSSSHTGLQAHMEDFLSTYTAELGVQTQDDYLSSFTAELGVQTQSFGSSCTAELGVQTHDCFQEICTADFGVQAGSALLGSLLEALDPDMGCETSMGEVMGTRRFASQGQPSGSMSSFLSVMDCGTGTDVPTLDSQTQTNKMTSSASGFSVDGDFAECSLEASSTLSPLHIPTNPKLFDSFDSDLSYSDCGTGTEDFFASTHTQTNTDYPTCSTSSFPPVLTGADESSHTHTQTAGMLENSGETSAMGLFQSTNSQLGATIQRSMNNYVSEESELMLSSISSDQSDNTSQKSMSTSSSMTDSVAAADMHTQTADDLLDFLMNNMETQTTEDISDNSMDMADIQTQTTGGVLLTPPHPFSFASDHTSPSQLDDDTLTGVTAETQTSGQCWLELMEDTEEFFDIADMQTQTNLDFLVD